MTFDYYFANHSAAGPKIHYRPDKVHLQPAERWFSRGRFTILPRILIIMDYLTQLINLNVDSHPVPCSF